MINIPDTAVIVFIFILQAILSTVTCIIELCACTDALNRGHNSWPAVWYYVVGIAPYWCRRHCVRPDFMQTQEFLSNRVVDSTVAFTNTYAFQTQMKSLQTLVLALLHCSFHCTTTQRGIITFSSFH